MSIIEHVFDAQLSIFGQPILWRETVGAGFGCVSAIGGLRRRVWAWPVGIIGNVLLFTVFFGVAFWTPQHPFAVKNGERFLILSGNHRVQAAKDAKLTEILVLYSARELSPAQQRAIQLSHNAIAGQDDLAILRELYDEINDVALKEYSGLDDVMLGQLNPPELDLLSEKGLEYRIVSIAFLPE